MSKKFKPMVALADLKSRFIFIGFEVDGVMDLGFRTDLDRSLCQERYGTDDIQALIEGVVRHTVNASVEYVDHPTHKELWLVGGWATMLRKYPPYTAWEPSQAEVEE